MRKDNSSKKSLKQRLGASRGKSILSRIGSSNKSAGNSRISNSLKNRLNKGQNKSTPALRRSAVNSGISRTRSSFGQNKHLFARAIEESTSSRHASQPTSFTLPTKKSMVTEDQPVSFRIPNGTIVKGLRSDSILLQKKHTVKTSPDRKYPNSRINLISRSQQLDSGGSRNRLLRPDTNRGRFQSREGASKGNSAPRRERLMRVESGRGVPYDSGKVSMSMNRGLTVNIKNEQTRRRLEARAMPRITIRNELPISDDDYDDSYMSEDSLPMRSNVHPYNMELRHMALQEPYMPPRMAARSRIQMQPYMQQPPVMSKIVVMQQPEMVPMPQPKPHKQILDSEVQTEIAALQGKYSMEKAGPGPGVKSFKMIPVITKKLLTDRFRHDKPEK